MRINNNIAAMNTHTKLANAQGAQAKSLEKLSSGLRINRASDDATGLAISEKMRGQIGGLNQAVKNAQDGISLIQTAEGALNETHSILQRMRELAVQGANDTNTESDRGEIQKEINQLASEVTRIAEKTSFNGQKLMGAGDTKTDRFQGKLQIGANSGETLGIDIGSMDATTLKVGKLEAGVTAAETQVSFEVGDNDEFTIGGVDASSYKGTRDIDIKITMKTTGVDTTGKAVATISINGGTAVDVEADAVGAATPTFTLKADKFSNFKTGESIEITGANTPEELDVAHIKIKSATVEGTAGLDVTTSDMAQSAIATIDTAIGTVSTERSKLGAVQSRLDHTIANLTTTSENLSAAESRIRDVDMAKEMMSFTKNNILNQASTAMLAQANQMPQGVLQLLG